jgi:hypothetical protein
MKHKLMRDKKYTPQQSAIFVWNVFNKIQGNISTVMYGGVISFLAVDLYLQ